ncbi:hypothetical protein BJX63DRAFT_405249 [Aspergillus granulosus]|uniref:Uncharacterized protein n=1 Tax=Aspergillus granulosus TaxID=176169 RepID=A0ABR4H250_9EURO
MTTWFSTIGKRIRCGRKGRLYGVKGSGLGLEHFALRLEGRCGGGSSGGGGIKGDGSIHQGHMYRLGPLLANCGQCGLRNLLRHLVTAQGSDLAAALGGAFFVVVGVVCIVGGSGSCNGPLADCMCCCVGILTAERAARTGRIPVAVATRAGKPSRYRNT